ncbi:hypothetical protein J3B02_001482 [Coemansia erecta]|nr:hypothetical protein J3B02_001482 [Coemansia erecta]
MFCRSGSNKDISSNSNYKRCKSNTSDCHTDDSEEDIQVVLPNTRKLLSSTSASAPSSRMRQSRKPKDMFMPSSPQLLHPSSPTIRRYNSQTSQPIVLSESTQDAAFSNTKEAVSSTVDNTLEGCTLVCSSFSRSNTARSLDRRSNNQALLALDLIKEMELSSAPTSTAPANSNIVPETPRMSPLHTPRRLSPPPDSPKLVPLPPLPQQNQQKQQKPHQLSGIPADIQRYLQTDLPSDPISEFGSPANSPSASRVSEFPNALDRGMRLCENENIDCHEDQQDSMDNGSSSLAEQPSITQWYHEGLSKYKEKEKEDDDEEDFADFTQSRSLGLDDPSQLSGDPDDYSSHMDNSVSRENGVENKDGVDDGYSSPLEGFWDLRNSGDWSTQDREMYVNQFAPSKRQVALRKRAQEKRDAMHSSLNNASSDSGGPGPQDIPIGPEATLSETATRAGRRSKGPKRVSTRKRAPRSGRSGGPKSTRGGRFAKGRKKSGIKPMSSSRARTAAATATAAAAQSSASTRRIASSTAAAAYNHYANEPVLDIAASLNWEGGGIARFG